MDEGILATSYFGLHEWNFKNENTKQLWSRMSQMDRQIFCFDIKNFEWKNYLTDFSIGLRLYVVNDPLETVAKGKAKSFNYKIAHYTLAGFLLFIVLTMLYRLFL